MTECPIVYVHLGGRPPAYAKESVQQARRWNPGRPIYILCDEIPEPENRFDAEEEWITTALLCPQPIHEQFQAVTQLDTTFRGGFWRFTTERLFTLYDWMCWKGVEQCFHLEYDNMIYANLDTVLDAVASTAGGMLAPFLGSPPGYHPHVGFGVTFIKNQATLEELLTGLATPVNLNEMEKAGQMWIDNTETFGILPVGTPGCRVLTESNRSKVEAAGPWVKRKLLVDPAQYGQYLAGDDMRNPGAHGPGYVNPNADVPPDQYTYDWIVVDGLRVPVARDSTGDEWRFFNLHIHSKDLGPYMS